MVSFLLDRGIVGINNIVSHWTSAKYAGYGTFSNLSSVRADYSYTLLSVLTGNDVVVAIANDPNGTTPCNAWYRNRTASQGYSNDLDIYRSHCTYLFPWDKSPTDIVAIGINPKMSNRCYAWYWDGTYSIGTNDNLGYYS